MTVTKQQRRCALRVLEDYGPRATKQLAPLLLHLLRSYSGTKGQKITKTIGAYVYTLEHQGDVLGITRVHHTKVD